MAIRKIKTKERNNGMKFCTFCKPARIDAIYRDSRMSLACEDHKHLLEKTCNEELSEADYQTWYKL